MPIIKEDNNRSSQKNSILFLISLIIISVGILFLIIGYVFIHLLQRIVT